MAEHDEEVTEAEVAPDIEDLKEAGRTAARWLKSRTAAAVESATERVRQAERPDFRVLLLDAKKLTDATNRRLQDSYDSLSHAHDDAASALAALGAAEVQAFDESLRHFADVFGRLKNVTLSELLLEDTPPTVTELAPETLSIDFEKVDAAKALLLGGGTGAAAGMTTFAAVSTMGAASTGTAIAGLSGAAATNATLAWLGGGSMATGGGGVAAGTAVLGGIVALPVLAVGGVAVHHAGRKAMAEAQAGALRAEEALAQMELARTTTLGIKERADGLRVLVERLDRALLGRNGALALLVTRSSDFAAWSSDDRDQAMLAATTAKTLRAAVDVPVINDGGELTEDSLELIEGGLSFLDRHDGELRP